MQDCDVIVIGAGMAGASIATELAARQARVIVLEMEDAPGRHTTGRSAALFSEIYGNAVIRALTRASRPRLAEGFMTPRDCLHIASAEQLERLEAYAALPDVAGASRRVSAAEAIALCPILRPDYVAGALAELNAYDIDVDALHQAYLRQIRSLGGAVICDARLERAERTDGVWTVTAGGAAYRAPILVNAAGAWGDVVAALAGVAPLGLAPKRRTIAIVPAPKDGRCDDSPFVVDVDEQFYFKAEAGRIMISPADETPSDPCDAAPDELDVAIAIDRAQAAADLPVTRVLSSWAGLRTFAPDRTPVLGFDAAAAGFFWCVGQGGYGIQTAPAMGGLGAALVLGAAPPAGLEDLDPALLSPARFG
ncbi:NAD(P)/FAD-dependent oxidoreductase [Phenylobacterium aquaticum]|uniref:NAD(P)/FAD-dependent oxidoreductase n=1 Tax=Phenylobacterium aquaticum TaxID=1763816 RepID=UPI001F5D1C92|nr:FAD-binding oxidoreductase [Phenylobacterium aquaticum]MCI3134905.1 FAD-binding oxidoreductase [Phenylobacterium aquaticum]